MAGFHDWTFFSSPDATLGDDFGRSAAKATILCANLVVFYYNAVYLVLSGDHGLPLLR
ncbi:MAG TPA: hypothetical protein VGO57_02445 [Verrucomicrobiae bacterium]